MNIVFTFGPRDEKENCYGEKGTFCRNVLKYLRSSSSLAIVQKKQPKSSATIDVSEHRVSLSEKTIFLQFLFFLPVSWSTIFQTVLFPFSICNIYISVFFVHHKNVSTNILFLHLSLYELTSSRPTRASNFSKHSSIFRFGIRCIFEVILCNLRHC